MACTLGCLMRKSHFTVATTGALQVGMVAGSTLNNEWFAAELAGFAVDFGAGRPTAEVAAGACAGDADSCWHAASVKAAASPKDIRSVFFMADSRECCGDRSLSLSACSNFGISMNSSHIQQKSVRLKIVFATHVDHDNVSASLMPVRRWMAQEILIVMRSSGAIISGKPFIATCLI